MNMIEKVRSAVDYIERHLAEDLDLDRIAAALHYSKYHLHRAFSATVGLTIHDYLKRRRLTEGARRLIESDQPILEIALTSGYESQQAFSAIFKEMYKLSPGQFRERGVFYPLQLRFDFKGSFAILDGEEKDLYSLIRPGTEDDIPCWMDLVYLVVDGFPFLQEEEHIGAIKESIRRKQAFILKDGGIAAGVMQFSADTGIIDFLGIHPLYHRTGVAGALIAKALDQVSPEQEYIRTTTFRDGDKANTGYRKMLSQLGFIEDELLIEYGYPTQQFILPVEKI